jgi:hypothetical protein
MRAFLEKPLDLGGICEPSKKGNQLTKIVVNGFQVKHKQQFVHLESRFLHL